MFEVSQSDSWNSRIPAGKPGWNIEKSLEKRNSRIVICIEHDRYSYGLRSLGNVGSWLFRVMKREWVWAPFDAILPSHIGNLTFTVSPVFKFSAGARKTAQNGVPTHVGVQKAAQFLWQTSTVATVLCRLQSVHRYIHVTSWVTRTRWGCRYAQGWCSQVSYFFPNPSQG